MAAFAARRMTASRRARIASMRSSATRNTGGFGDPERMRRAFVSLFGRPPSALRAAHRH